MKDGLTPAQRKLAKAFKNWPGSKTITIRYTKADRIRRREIAAFLRRLDEAHRLARKSTLRFGVAAGFVVLSPGNGLSPERPVKRVALSCRRY